MTFINMFALVLRVSYCSHQPNVAAEQNLHVVAPVKLRQNACSSSTPVVVQANTARRSLTFPPTGRKSGP
uniref:Putative secreted protein n=1 Tax=Ixodes ricinus TaxID=34613 RepID=A0A6B0TRH1_IXORI